MKYPREITYIDSTAPTSAIFEATSTSNSIKVTASGIDNESGITHYQFSKDGESTWLPSTPQTSSTYTFDGLTSGSYNIKVRVYNGTYNNGGRLYKDSDTKTITTLRPPTINSFIATSGSTSGYNTTLVTLTATATSEVGISKYVFYQGGTIIKTVETSTSSATVQVTSLGTTSYQFTVVVYDIDGNSSSSSLTESCSLLESLACTNGYRTNVYTCTGTGRKYSVSRSCDACPNDDLRSISCNDCYDFSQSKGNEVYHSCSINGGSNCSSAASSAASSAKKACDSCCY